MLHFTPSNKLDFFFSSNHLLYEVVLELAKIGACVKFERQLLLKLFVVRCRDDLWVPLSSPHLTLPPLC